MDALLKDLLHPLPYEVILALLGLSFLGAAWLPKFLRGRPLSFPIVYVLFGALLFFLPINLPDPLPLHNPKLTEHLTEILVIIALVGAGLKVDRPLGFRSWGLAWRLLSVTMLGSIALTAYLGWQLVGLSLASALLLGAVLAPTDPVLASDVQVGTPNEGEEDAVRFGLTAEAGFNDGLAFPFTYLAILVAARGANPELWAADFLSYYLIYKLAVGVAAGWSLGLLLMRLIFRSKAELRISHSGEGFVALAVMFLVYGVTELLQGYGFLAVFVAALALRHYEREHDYHGALHNFAEQSERLLMVIILILFGGALSRGLLADLTWAGALSAVLVILLVRPLTGLIGLLGTNIPWRERWALSFFGIRGVGSLYYLAYASAATHFADIRGLWSIVGFTILLSVIIHGISAPVAIEKLDEKREHDGAETERAGSKETFA